MAICLPAVVHRLSLSVALLVAVGCAPSAVVVRAPSAPVVEPASEAVWVTPAADLRPEAQPRLLGTRRHNVGSGGRPLHLDRPVAAWVTERLMAVLADRGLHPRLLQTASHPAVWIEPRIQDLALTVGADDRFDLTLALILHRGDQEVWSHSRELHEARFTGVGGTTLGHLIYLLQEDVDQVWGDLLTAMATNEQPPATRGRVEVVSTPAGARVYLDGVYYGTTPFTAELRPGVHELRLVPPLAPEIHERLAVVAGRTTRYEAVLPTGDD